MACGFQSKCWPLLKTIFSSLSGPPPHRFFPSNRKKIMAINTGKLALFFVGIGLFGGISIQHYLLNPRNETTNGATTGPEYLTKSPSQSFIRATNSAPSIEPQNSFTSTKTYTSIEHKLSSPGHQFRYSKSRENTERYSLREPHYGNSSAVILAAGQHVIVEGEIQYAIENERTRMPKIERILTSASFLYLERPSSTNTRDWLGPSLTIRHLLKEHSIKDCAECPEMVVIPPGSFQMGSPASERGRQTDEGPIRDVKIGYPLAVGRHEVTRGEYRRFVTATGYRTAGNCVGTNGSKRPDWIPHLNWENPGFNQGEDHPVVCVSWNDAKAYLNWLNNIEPNRGYRLLSEAEWEYAARAGLGTGPFVWQTEIDPLEQCKWANGADQKAKEQISWMSNNENANCDDGYAYTSPVGSYRANAFGLYDMHGNVWEWVEDIWRNSYVGAPTDGSALLPKNTHALRVLRGGSWLHEPTYLRSAQRLGMGSSFVYSAAGFRIGRKFDN
jgi:formylglycine-generating enzyme required for sulfatase activity